MWTANEFNLFRVKTKLNKKENERDIFSQDRSLQPSQPTFNCSHFI